MAPPATPDAKGAGDEGLPFGPPPGLEVAQGASPNDNPEAHMEQIRRNVLEHTDLHMQEKVDQIWSRQEAKLKAFDQVQEQARLPLEEQMHFLRDKVASLEADKAELRKTCFMMQEQLSFFSAQLQAQSAHDMFKLMGGTPEKMPMGGNLTNAGMLGAFATYPTPFLASPTPPEMSQAEQPSVIDQFSKLPPAFVPPSAPATPTLAPSAPPGLEPPMLKAETAGGPDQLFEPAKASPHASHTDALRMMREYMEKDAGGAAESSSVFQSPGAKGGTPARKEPASPLPFQSPSSFARQRSGTPSRSSPLIAGLNRTPKRTPRLSFNRGMKSPSICPSPFVICESGGTVFGFTLRRADDSVLGLDVEHTDDSNGLKVTAIKHGGAMAAWNKQCAGGPAAGKAVVPGDRIVKVNLATTPSEMLKECRETKLMKFTVVRGDLDGDIDPLCVGQN